MSFAAGNLASNLLGYFREKERGRPFEYKANPMQGLLRRPLVRIFLIWSLLVLRAMGSVWLVF